MPCMAQKWILVWGLEKRARSHCVWPAGNSAQGWLALSRSL